VLVLGKPLNAGIITGFLLIVVESWLSTGGPLPGDHARREHEVGAERVRG
jgi:hypothetical protein